MSQRSQKRKDADELAKQEQTYATRNEAGDPVFKVSDIRYPATGPSLSRVPGTGEPSVSQTSQGDNSAAKESRTGTENGFVDAPGARVDASGTQADNKRDASPDQRPKLVEEDQSQDA
jgi:hypothetical protein